MDKIPVLKLTCDERGLLPDMASIHFVDSPAIKETWLLFNSEPVPLAFSEDKRILTGPAMIPDLPILRFQPLEQGGQPMYFYVVADKEAIANTAKAFARNGKLGKVGIGHKEEYPEGVHLLEAFMSDEDRGISNPKGFEHLPNGTLYFSFLVDNDEVWADAKSGKLNGISLQNKWPLQFSDISEEQKTALLLDEANELLEKITKRLGAAIQ